MIELADLNQIFGFFGIGLGFGVGLATIFFIIGSAVGFVLSLANK